MEGYILFDIVIAAALVLFALWGMHRGLVMTLCSLVAVLVAFVGGIFVANLASPAVSGIVEPHITSAIETQLEEAIQHTEFIAAPGSDSAVAEKPDEVSLSGVLDVLEDMGLHGSLIDAIREAVESGMEGAAASAAAQVGAAAARFLAFWVVFLAAFVIILILWSIFSRTLDLVAKLPGLNGLNKAGGLLFGALKGCVFLFVAAGLVRWFGSGLIPSEAVEQTYLLRFFMTTNPLDFLAKL